VSVKSVMPKLTEILGNIAAILVIAGGFFLGLSPPEFFVVVPMFAVAVAAILTLSATAVGAIAIATGVSSVFVVVALASIGVFFGSLAIGSYAGVVSAIVTFVVTIAAFANVVEDVNEHYARKGE